MDGRSSSEPEDEQSGALQAKPDRLALWFRTWTPNVRRWLSRRGSVPASELDDLAQEVFVRLLRYAEETVVENPLGYILTIASNVASEWKQLSRVSQPHRSTWLDELIIGDHEEPEKYLSRKTAGARIQSAIDSLPSNCRDALLLRINEGMKYKEIARVLQRSERMVRRDLSYAYGELRVMLDIEDLR